MKLYLITRPDDVSYDEFDGAVVCAENEEDARSIHPNNYEEPVTDENPTSSWIPKSKVIVTYLGEPTSEIKRGIILSSFNSG